MKHHRLTPLALLLAAALTLGSGFPSTPIQVAAPRSAVRGAALPPAQATAIGPTDPVEGKPTQPPEVVKLDIDALLTDHLAKLYEFQTEYYKANGTYFQALPSNGAPPEDGKVAVPDKPYDGPTDQLAKNVVLWDFLKLAAQLPCSWRVDVYQGPEGPGYVLTAEVVLEKQTYQRVINTGPEQYRESGWAPVVLEKAP